MLNFTITNWQQALLSAVPDPVAGIQIAHISGDETFSLYITSIPGGKYVNAHYHLHGLEIYQIVEGEGILHLAQPSQDQQSINKSRYPVRAGDCFTIAPNTIHQLENCSSAPLILIFGCPAAHLGMDRVTWQSLLA